MEDQIAEGRQIYLVYPLIEESATLDHKDLMDGYESIVRRFPMPDYQVAIVHGRMKPEDKAWEMDRFAKGQAQILVATTVIEVGVNVPNASVMVIESSERFGLSQLHQLRGRVGRGASQSYCILMSKAELGADARRRLETMCRTNDGLKSPKSTPPPPPRTTTCVGNACWAVAEVFSVVNSSSNPVGSVCPAPTPSA